MTFQNDKKNFLEKIDKSKKGHLDEKIIPLINTINQSEKYYTTSSCSGRVYLWKGTGKKNETEWLKVSHNLINKDFLKTTESGFIWLRLEPLIMHICCKDLESAKELLQQAKTIYKKSSILSISNKIIIEIRGSEFIEMPFYQDNKLLYNGELSELTSIINQKLELIWEKTNKLKEIII